VYFRGNDALIRFHAVSKLQMDIGARKFCAVVYTAIYQDLAGELRCVELTAKSDLSTTSSYRETLQAVNWTFSRGSHEIHVESYSLRDLHCSLPSSSVAIQSARQRSLKSSLRYTYTRNEPWIRKITMEAAGFWGDVKFLKLDGLVGRSVDLPNSFDCSFNAGGGALVQLDGKESCLQDRFFLGGPSGCSQILKGYAFRRAGPSDKRHHSDEYDAVGGNLFGAAYFSLGRQVTMGSNTSRVFTLPLFVGISFFKLVLRTQAWLLRE